MIKGTSGGDFNAGLELELRETVGFGVWVVKGCCLLHCSSPTTKAPTSFETSATVTQQPPTNLPS